jgi:hypothetical protein
MAGCGCILVWECSQIMPVSRKGYRLWCGFSDLTFWFYSGRTRQPVDSSFAGASGELALTAEGPFSQASGFRTVNRSSNQGDE